MFSEKNSKNKKENNKNALLCRSLRKKFWVFKEKNVCSARWGPQIIKIRYMKVKNY